MNFKLNIDYFQIVRQNYLNNESCQENTDCQKVTSVKIEVYNR